MITVKFLGTSSQIPTAERNHTAVLLSYQSGKSNENILIDCGENTQRQMRIMKISPNSIDKIFLTHWHGDHTLGLPGLIQTLNAHNYSKVLDVYGPKGIKKFFDLMLKAFLLEKKIDFRVHEIEKGGIIYECCDFKIEAYFMEHTAPCLGYSFTENDRRRINMSYLKKINVKPGPALRNLHEGRSISIDGKHIGIKKATEIIKGKKVAIVLDTKYNKNMEKLCRNSDVLIAESTFSEELKNKAKEYKHLTSAEAGKIAKKCRAKKLILTHISQRYENELNKILSEARKVFKPTELAKDFMVLEI